VVKNENKRGAASKTMASNGGAHCVMETGLGGNENMKMQ
jgi:hypothetical protein